MHPLTLEDIVNTNQRPKMDDFGNYLFIVLNMVSYNDETRETASEQVSLIISSKFVISFQEGKPGDVFDSVRQRIRSGKGKIRKNGNDYLAYALVDAIVDNYFLILEKIGEDVEELEVELIKNPDHKTLSGVYKVKRELIFMRRYIWPLRDVISKLQRGESRLIKKSTEIYLKDVYDHTVRVMETIETFRDMISGMIDVYLSSVSNKLNEIMKVLTTISTIFIPLTFLVGVYGMNFHYIPELNWKWSYFVLWFIMVSVGVLMFVNFKKRKWV